MALGDGIRRNVRTITAHERQRFTNALLALQGRTGHAASTDVSGPSADYWFTLDEIREATQIHHGAEFLPWHRELCDRFEQMLRDVDPELSLHYWDWNEDPHELFTPTFAHSDSTDVPFEGVVWGPTWTPQDAEIVRASSFQRMRTLLERKHDAAHFVYFGGTFVNAHVSFHDPYAFLLHSNVDRLFAMWQAQSGHAWRLDPSQVYGNESYRLGALLIEPWSTVLSTRPWMSRDALPAPKTYVHPSVVAPPCYDTLPTRVVVDPVTNPDCVINFNDVYAGKTFASAASFQVHGCGNLTFEVTNGPTGPYAVITPAGAVTVAHSPVLYQEARIWFGFTGGTPNTQAAAGTVTIRCRETNEDFMFTLRGNTIPVPNTGVVPSLDDATRALEQSTTGQGTGVTWTWTWRPAGG